MDMVVYMNLANVYTQSLNILRDGVLQLTKIIIFCFTFYKISPFTRDFILYLHTFYYVYLIFKKNSIVHTYTPHSLRTSHNIIASIYKIHSKTITKQKKLQSQTKCINIYIYYYYKLQINIINTNITLTETYNTTPTEMQDYIIVGVRSPE